MENTQKPLRGFAAMDADARRAIASKGGKAHTAEYMRQLGRKGGKASAKKRQRHP
jgi:general stress protein YciG